MERKGESPEEKEGYYELIEPGREQRSREREEEPDCTLEQAVGGHTPSLVLEPCDLPP